MVRQRHGLVAGRRVTFPQLERVQETWRLQHGFDDQTDAGRMVLVFTPDPEHLRETRDLRITQWPAERAASELPYEGDRAVVIDCSAGQGANADTSAAAAAFSANAA